MLSARRAAERLYLQIFWPQKVDHAASLPLLAKLDMRQDHPGAHLSSANSIPCGAAKADIGNLMAEPLVDVLANVNDATPYPKSHQNRIPKMKKDRVSTEGHAAKSLQCGGRRSRPPTIGVSRLHQRPHHQQDKSCRQYRERKLVLIVPSHHHDAKQTKDRAYGFKHRLHAGRRSKAASCACDRELAERPASDLWHMRASRIHAWTSAAANGHG